MTQHLIDTPFDHQRFKNKSGWSPPGPRALEAFILRNKVGLNKKPIHAPRHNNLTLEEEHALKALKEDLNIIIKPADKGSAVVVMSKKDYILEGLRQLGDHNFYKEVDTNLTQEHKDLVKRQVNLMLFNKEISQKCAQ